MDLGIHGWTQWWARLWNWMHSGSNHSMKYHSIGSMNGSPLSIAHRHNRPTTYGGTISDGGKPPSTQRKKKDSGVAQVFAKGSASVGHTMAPIVLKEVLQVCVVSLVCFVSLNWES